ncbi:hypothetical protein ACFE04_017146 [Oxalis oulophora]
MATPYPGNGAFRALGNKLKANIDEIVDTAKQVARNDPRTVVHSLKVGLAITLISMFYYFKPLYSGFGVNAMWAVLTVVVVMEFSVGATIGKGLNRMIATLFAGGLAVGAHHIATLSGEIGEPLLIGTFVFIIVTVVTFIRFFPKANARYDYGLSIIILTFSLVSVSGYRDSQVFVRARERVTTIIIGSATAFLVCIFVAPIWVGEDLHKQVARDMERLAHFLEGYPEEYFHPSLETKSESDKSFLAEYKSVLTSEDSLKSKVRLARWEPGHGRFKFYFPWKLYLNVGAQLRECAHKIHSLHNILLSEVQSPLEIRRKIEDMCTTICIESSKALKELSSTIKKMKHSKSADVHIANSKAAAENLKTLLTNSSLWIEDENLFEVLPSASVASLMLQIMDSIEKIAEAVHDLSIKAGFELVENIVVELEEPPNLTTRVGETHCSVTVNE